MDLHCTNGLFSDTFLSSGPMDTCSVTDMVDWGDGKVEQTPAVGGRGNEKVVLFHQYSKPEAFEVEITNRMTCPSGYDHTFSSVWYTVEVPGPQKCEDGGVSAAADEDPCSDRNCAFSFLGLCIVDTDLKDAYDEVKDLKKKIQKAKAIPDPEVRKKTLRKLEEKLRSAITEYEELVKQAEKEAKRNANRLGIPVRDITDQVNNSLKGL
jgi:hypothetical protein